MIHPTSPTTVDTRAQERAAERFRASMPRAASYARLHRHIAGHCPLNPMQTVEHDGTVYAVERLENGGFDTLSNTAKDEITIVSHANGQAVTFPQVIRKLRRNKTSGAVTVRYNASTGNYSEWDELIAALVAEAARRLHHMGRVAA